LKNSVRPSFPAIPALPDERLQLIHINRAALGAPMLD
jgi:hypothetical protein